MKEVRVTVELPGAGDVVAGTLTEIPSRTGSTPSATFAYESAYLKQAGSYNLSPDLYFSGGPQATPIHRQMFMAFEDAAPDTWGRDLIQEQARLEARARGEYAGRLSSFQSLVRVPDHGRQGALRFWDGEVALRHGGPAKPIEEWDWVRLVEASRHFTAPHEIDEGLRQLFRYGTSAGGARPKVTVSRDGRLSIAKLPHRDDRWDVSRWEAAALIMAGSAGIAVPNHRVQPFDHDRSILLLDRFDRDELGHRIGYISARTLLEIEDQDQYRGSYTQLAERLGQVGGRADLPELYRRVAFTVMVTNADDHMRNHGLLRGRDGWRLAPSFDVNPALNPSFESTPITPQSDRVHRDLRELLDVREAFELTEHQARLAIKEVESATRDWAAVGRSLGEPEESIGFFADAFEHLNREWARGLSVDEADGVLRGPNTSGRGPGVRRGDVGLGRTAGGGNRGSFAKSRRNGSEGRELRADD